MVFLLVTACGAPDPLAEFEPGERGRVVRVIDGDAIALNTGLSVRLAGITAPSPAWEEREEEAFARESKAIMERLVLGREVQLFYGGLSRDRYDRAIAQVRTTDGLGDEIWLNLEMVERGAARVRIYPDNESLADTLLEAEARAREAGRGLWSLEAYQLQDATQMDRRQRGFLIGEGWIVPAAAPRLAERSEDAEARPPRPVACRLGFGQATIEIAPMAAIACTTPPGSRVRVRGWFSRGTVRLDSAANLERLDAP